MQKKRNKEGDYKIKLVYYDFENNLSVENVWAAKEGDNYRIKNIPFFAPNLAYNDLVGIEDDNGELFFDSLIEPSGHSTIQIVFFDLQYFEQVTNDLIMLNCSWEGSHLKECISVDVPKGVDYPIIKNYLKQKRDEKKIDFKEACLAHHE